MADLVAAPLVVVGRIMPASNYTFLARLDDGEECVYKPVSGEQPLWDFPDGTLAAREYAAWVVSEHLGWNIVPPTALREGPAGPGMVQRWIEVVETDGPDPVEVVPDRRLPAGYLHVLDAAGAEGEPVSLVHEDTTALRRMAVFDIVVNNTDRKGGHILPAESGHRYGVDHGVCFHVEDKLRTVLWGWAGQHLTAEETEGVQAVLAGLRGPLRSDLEDLLSVAEVEALERRCRRLAERARFPRRSGGWPSIPWPPF